jgi:single-stranded-DNA-specific exonuclease
MQKQWTILPEEAEKTRTLAAALKIHPALCRILVQRGIEDFEQAKNYFRPQLSDLHAPWLMKDMEKAVERILDALHTREKILVFGDYDVDGTTAVASLLHFFRKVYSPELVDFYIPHRYREGYGISKMGIDFAAENGFSLIISLDCGIKSAELVAYAATLDIDFIICDHHLPDANLPAAIAILNPRQPGCPYPYKDLCGCGVGFKLIGALAERMEIPGNPSLDHLDLLATAIAADVVPVTGENRVLSYYGLKKANENPNYGIKALTEMGGLRAGTDMNTLVFMVAPRINAAGRMDEAGKAVQLFVAASSEEAMGYARILHSDNTDRKEADNSITEEALSMIRNDERLIGRKSTVLYQPHWHKGVVGIVASRLIEKYYRPTVVLTRSGEVVAGSARSVNGFNLYEAIHACREHLLGYGGHFAAAGLTLLAENLESFSLKFEEIVSATIGPDSLFPEIFVDTEIAFKDISTAFHRILCQMEPFGPGNRKPVFIARRVFDNGYSRIVKDQHIRFSLEQEQLRFDGIGFNLADKFHLLQPGKALDILFHLDENEWNNQKSLQLKVLDLRTSEV